MSRIFTLLILACSLTLTTVTVVAQGSDPVAAANTAYDNQEYYKAIDLFKKAYRKVKDKAKKAEIIYKVAECYRLINDYKQAETWYRKALKIRYPDPILHLHYAEAMRSNGKYEEAVVQFNKYAEEVPDDPRGKKGAEAAAMAQKWVDNPTRYEVDNVAQLNGRYNDYAAAYAKKNYKVLIFSSMRDDAHGSEVDGWTGESFSDLFETKLDNKGKWSKPTPLPEPVNTEHHEGAPSLDEKGKVMYFTRCKKKKKEEMGCELFKTEAQGSNWKDPELLPFGPQADSILVTNGHPSLSKDETMLFFASDLEGGQGGKDIWVSTWSDEKKRWQKPVNLGSDINTPGDDMYPFIHADGTLYFASNGHMGMGGLDIFKAEKTGDMKWGNVTNMRHPLNSPADDFAIIFENETEKGYFTSNRSGGKGGDDLYSFILPQLQFTLQGVVKDYKTKEVVPGAKITLVGTDGTSLETTTDNSGFYKFDLSPATSYVITAGKEGDYLNKTGKTTTVGFEEDKALVHDFELDPIDKVIDLPNIYYDLGRWELRPESKVALDGLIETLNNNPTIVIELGAHTDTRASNSFNLTLSQKRAQSVVDYLIEHGINPERLVAKGYGEEVPRVIPFDVSFFKAGDVITDEYIAELPNEEMKEEAHQMNRRTEFKVLRNDFVPKEQPKN